MVISLRIAGKILLFLPRGIKKISIFVPTWYHYWCLKASAYIPTFTVLHLTLCNIPLAVCSMQHDSQTAFAVCACHQQEYYRLHITIQRVMWTFYTHLHLNYWACALLMVVTMMYTQLIMLSAWCRAVSVVLCCLIGHISRIVTYACPCTNSNTKITPVRGIAVMSYRWRSLLSKS